uniref:Thionin n=1 Tax=Viscum album TaxID=3972 RepID=Q9S9A1_VISAL|nr:thionin precursor {clone Thi1Va1} [Viscum album=mistletoe, Peptide, 115 aa] [Viscum album]
MEGARASSLLLLLLLGALVVYDVESKICCRAPAGKKCYNLCTALLSSETCANTCYCKDVSGETCPADYPAFYCNLGCQSSLCAKSNGEAEAVRCMTACSDLCGSGITATQDVDDA